MNRFTRTVLTLMVGLIAVCGLLMVAARTLAEPSAYTTLFRYPDGTRCDTPCIIGIRAGETPFLEALTLLRAHPLTRELNRVELAARGSVMYESEQFAIEVSWNAQGLVQQVSLQMEPTLAQRYRFTGRALPPLPRSPLRAGTLGEVLVALGKPDYVEMYSRGAGLGRTLRVHYQIANLSITHLRGSSERVNMYDPLDQLFMYTVPADVTPNFYRWRGFTSFFRYAGMN